MPPLARWICGALGLAAISLAAAPAQAQLPGVGGLPGLPAGGMTRGGLADLGPGLTVPVETLRRVRPVIDPVLSAARGVRMEALIRDHADVIDVDSQGQAVVRDQVLILSPAPASLAIALGDGFKVGSETTLEGLGLSMVTLIPPQGLSAREAVARLRALDPAGRYDFNHIYLGAGPVAGARRGPAAGGGGAAGLRIGLVDGGVGAHPSLGPMEQRGFAPGGLTVSAHGTAVASLLVGQDRNFRGGAPGARLLVADVYGKSPTGGSAAIIAQALAWMAQNRVPVINISLVGPPNLALKAAVSALLARGHVLVAAVGNDGPAAPALYPAAYPGVVSVTGVDGRRRVLPEAGRAGHVDFAAPGADMAGAAAGGGYVALRGTSFAAPLVAGQLAGLLSRPDRTAAAAAVTALSRQATDLGVRGTDSIYGKGLVAFDLRTAPRDLGVRRGLLTGR